MSLEDITPDDIQRTIADLERELEAAEDVHDIDRLNGELHNRRGQLVRREAFLSTLPRIEIDEGEL